MSFKIISILLVIHYSPLSAQTLTSSASTPHSGGVLKKQQIEYVNTGNGDYNKTWDLSGIEVVNPRHRVRVLTKRDTADVAVDTIMTVENRQRRYMLLRQDSLLTTGMENALSKVSFEQPELSLTFPFSYGDSTASVFYGTASWCEHSYSRVYGESRVKADAKGTLITPDGDTLRQVLRIHTRRIIGSQTFPVGTEPDMKSLLSKSSRFTTDDARTNLSRDIAETNVTTEDIFQFFVTGYRYPVIETRRALSPDGKVSEEAYYCPPSEQELLADEENEQIRNSLLLARGRQGLGEGRNGGSDTDTPPSPLSRCDVTVNGSMVTVTYDLTENAMVTGLVSTVSGIVLRQSSQHNDAGTGYQMRLDCGGLRAGQYVLYRNVNGQVTGYTVNLQ
jgi:hypothetical protein